MNDEHIQLCNCSIISFQMLDMLSFIRKQLKSAVHQSPNMHLICFIYMILYNQAIEIPPLLTAPKDRT